MFAKTERYYYDGTELSYITDSSNNLRFFFTRDAAGRLLNMVDYTGTSDKTHWYVYNGHGDIVKLVDSNGSTVVEYSYDA